MVSKYINIEVVYAKDNVNYKLVKLKLENHKEYSVLDVIKKSKILYYCTDINLAKNKVSIFGQLVNLDYIVSDQDTVAILRGLTISPMEARIQRVAKKYN
tara:strand:+ start:1651 stop:1950 length:300 start_codon:yes stop_codon:yes gene_type:complete